MITACPPSLFEKAAIVQEKIKIKQVGIFYLTYTYRDAILFLPLPEGGVHGNENPKMVLVLL